MVRDGSIEAAVRLVRHQPANRQAVHLGGQPLRGLQLHITLSREPRPRGLGLAVGLVLADSVREAIAATLSVGTLVLRQLSYAKGYRAIGAAVSGVLQSLHGGVRRALRLLVCGHLVGLWGAPWRWDPARQVIERSPFSSAGTTPSG